MDLIQSLAIGAGVLFFLFALFVLLVVVFVKLRGGRKSGSAIVPPNPYLGGKLRERMEAEDRDDAERVVSALYATGRHLNAQAERDAKMKNLAVGLQGLFGGGAPNA